MSQELALEGMGQPGVGTGEDGVAWSLGSGTLLPSLSGEVGTMLVACWWHVGSMLSSSSSISECLGRL